MEKALAGQENMANFNYSDTNANVPNDGTLVLLQ